MCRAKKIYTTLSPLFFTFILVIFAPDEALSQSLTLDIGEPGGSTTARIIQLVALIAVLSLAPGLLVTITSFTRIVVVLSLLRTALGTQQSPPNVVLISLALFLSSFIMAPTFEQAWKSGISPLIEERIDEKEAFEIALCDFNFDRKFLVLTNYQWHPGIIGITAARMVDKFNLPTAILAKTNYGMFIVSIRSNNILNVNRALDECSDLLIEHGGH